MNWVEIKEKFTRKTYDNRTDRLDCTVLYSKLESYLKEKILFDKKLLKSEIDKIIVKQMVKYTNTELGKRKNAYEELFDLRLELDKMDLVA